VRVLYGFIRSFIDACSLLDPLHEHGAGPGITSGPYLPLRYIRIWKQDVGDEGAVVLASLLQSRPPGINIAYLELLDCGIGEVGYVVAGMGRQETSGRRADMDDCRAGAARWETPSGPSRSPDCSHSTSSTTRAWGTPASRHSVTACLPTQCSRCVGLLLVSCGAQPQHHPHHGGMSGRSTCTWTTAASGRRVPSSWRSS